MRVIAAYMLAVLGGNNAPDAAAIKAILKSVSVTAEDADIAKVVDALKGKSIDELIAAGKEKLAAVPTGGAAPAAGGAGPAAAAAEEAAPEAAEESEEEEDMGFSLFD